MADVYTDTTALAALVQTAYDRSTAMALRALPQWRATIDKHPAEQAMPGSSVTLSINKDFASLPTTPLSEDIQPDSVAPPAPGTVNVVLNEYGLTAKETLRLETLSFANPKPSATLSLQIARNMADTTDALIKAVADTGTNIVHSNGGNLTSSGSNASVTTSDKFNRNCASAGVTLLNRRSVMPKIAGGLHLALAHPDVLFDLMAENSATAWATPHTYGGDTAAFYAGTVGDLLGGRYISTTKVTKTTDGTGGIGVYNTYFLGREGIVEATAINPEIRVGAVIDPMKRFMPISWYGLLGWAIYRQEAVQKIRTTSSIAALV